MSLATCVEIRLRNVLSQARSVEAGNLCWEFVRVELAEIVESTVADRVSTAIGAGVDLGAETEPGAVQGVRWLLLEALSNLANNALAHTPAGGIVTVRCGTAGGSGYLEVTDTGVGIPVAEREEVLGRFYRGSNARGPGSGRRDAQ